MDGAAKVWHRRRTCQRPAPLTALLSNRRLCLRQGIGLSTRARHLQKGPHITTSLEAPAPHDPLATGLSAADDRVRLSEWLPPANRGSPVAYRQAVDQCVVVRASGLFLGFSQAYERHQSPLIIREALLVGFFLAGLVVLGRLQSWWLQPIVSSLGPLALFFGALGLTAITDNAALTYLGSQITDISDAAKYRLMAGAVEGGGLTVIGTLRTQQGVTLLKRGFADESIGAGGLLPGALLPTMVAAAAFLLL